MANHVKFVVNQNADIWKTNINIWAKRVRDAIADAMRAREPEIEAWMKANASWADETGLARSALYAFFFVAMRSYIMTFNHSPAVRYARYLEYDHAGKFAILAPAIDYWGPILVRDVQDILNG